MTLRLPRTRDIWCVTTAATRQTAYYDTEQAALNQWRHVGVDKAVLFVGTVLVDDEANEEAA